jgi:hypothetical protein
MGAGPIGEGTQPKEAWIFRRGALLIAFLLASGFAFSQAEQNNAEAAAQASPGKTQRSAAPCIQPTPLISVEDYTGPFRRVVLFVARKPEIKTVQPPLRQSSRVCALAPGQKFHLFIRNTFEPVTVLSSAFDAGLQQAQDSDPTFGQGAEGYGKRFAAALADRVSSDFFRTFVFPVIFKQDPRYYRLGEGTTRARMGHALTHVFVARGDSGKKMFNYSEWLGTTAALALGNTYHPGNRRGVGPASGRLAVSVGTDVGFDFLREFWPELVRKFKLPFRKPDAQNTAPAPAKPH